MPSNLYPVLLEGVQAALERYTYAVPPATNETRNYPLWPPVVFVTALAWVESSQTDSQTKICGIGVGAQYGIPSNDAMRTGTAAHRFILPRLQRYLVSRNVLAVAEQRITAPGLIGKVDLLIPDQAVFELKTTTGDRSSNSPDQYELHQAAIYSYMTGLPVYFCVVNLISKEVSVVFLPRDYLTFFATKALQTLALYLEVSPTSPPVPYGNCDICPYSAFCPKR